MYCISFLILLINEILILILRYTAYLTVVYMYVREIGIPVSLLLNATDLELPGRISRVEFIDLHGDVLTEIPTKYYDTRPALYNVSNIVTPSEFFYIKVCILQGHSVVQKRCDIYRTCHAEPFVIIFNPR